MKGRKGDEGETLCTKPDAIVQTSILDMTFSYLFSCHSNWLIIIIRSGGGRLTDTCVRTIIIINMQT